MFVISAGSKARTLTVRKGMEAMRTFGMFMQISAPVCGFVSLLLTRVLVGYTGIKEIVLAITVTVAVFYAGLLIADATFKNWRRRARWRVITMNMLIDLNIFILVVCVGSLLAWFLAPHWAQDHEGRSLLLWNAHCLLVCACSIFITACIYFQWTRMGKEYFGRTIYLMEFPHII